MAFLNVVSALEARVGEDVIWTCELKLLSSREWMSNTEIWHIRKSGYHVGIQQFILHSGGSINFPLYFWQISYTWETWHKCVTYEFNLQKMFYLEPKLNNYLNFEFIARWVGKIISLWRATTVAWNYTKKYLFRVLIPGLIIPKYGMSNIH